MFGSGGNDHLEPDETTNLSQREITNNPDWCVRIYGVGISEEAGAFTLLVCSATVFPS